MVDALDDPLSRRRWLGSLALGAGFVAGQSIGLPEADAAVRRELPNLSDPESNLRNIIRMQGSLREEDTRWWFTGMIFAVPGNNETPRPLVRFEGMEVYWFAHKPEGFQLGGHTVTFFRDIETHQYLREFKNPWTGRTDVVTPAVQGGNLGFNYSEEGIWPVRLDGSPMGEPKRAPLKLHWYSIGDYVWLQHQTVYPPGMPPMHGQRQSLFTRRQDFLDTRLDVLPATFSSTVFMGWLKWMNMTGEPGHVIWHAAGAKLRSIDELPQEYRERAEREYPARMTAKPK
ncbi:MAG: DUF1838 domain-containing protein [Gammaproteobacteria bacterium]|nr:DUF1838 domain-containing protein [Gammaproteobacteria bacterium]